ncbi:MAG: ATP-binding protein [Candidatus Omnitrophota bacterium]
MQINSIRFKITVLYTIILGIILILYSTFLYFSLHYTLYDELDNELQRKSKEVANTISSYLNVLGDEFDTFDLATRNMLTFDEIYPVESKLGEPQRQWLQKVDKFDLKEDYINLANIKGESLIRSGNFDTKILVLFSKEAKRLQDKELAFKSINFEKRNLRLLTTPFLCGNNKKYIIQIGTSLKPIIHLLKIRLFHIIISIPIFLIIASLFGKLLTMRILKPVMDITTTANNITHKDLSARVKSEHVDEEMKYLVDAFNDMISRLEYSFKYIVDFSSHVAHDLKTPLAIIRGESDVALIEERNPEEYKESFKIIQEETERMLKVIEDLLLLARLDYRPDFFKFEKFDINEFLPEIYEKTRLLASQKNILVNIDMSHEGKIHINGDKLQLRRLFLNLIDNAIKFNRENGKIDIIAKKEKDKVLISISDTGIGIKTEDMSKIFDRFFHIDDNTQDIKPGTGLGLSIVQSIVKIHDGTIQVSSTPNKGSTFIVTLPVI